MEAILEESGIWSSRNISAKVDHVSHRALAFGHTLVIVAMFSPPLVICWTLGRDMDVEYFAGHLALLPLLMAPLIVIVPAAHILASPRSKCFFIGTFLAPALIFAFVGARTMSLTAAATHAMQHRDCRAFAPKRGLSRAYKLASELRTSCYGSPHSEGILGQCGGAYRGLKEAHSREFQYLEGLERRLQCTGICSAGSSPLWVRSAKGVRTPSCELLVAQWLQGASSQAAILFGYALLAMLVSLPVGSHLFKPLV